MSRVDRKISWTMRDEPSTMRLVEAHRQELGRRLLELRNGCSWSQAEAAHQVGVSEKTWGEWERGKQRPYDHNWVKISETFGVDLIPLRTAIGDLDLGTGETQLDRMERLLNQIHGVVVDEPAEVSERRRPTEEALGDLGHSDADHQPSGGQRRRRKTG